MSAPTTRELLAEVLHQHILFGYGECACGALMKERGKYSFEHREHLADAILASPAIDAIVAERVAALAEDEAALNAVWDAMESHGHNGIECRPEKPMDYTAVYVIHALAAVLAERRSSDG